MRGMRPEKYFEVVVKAEHGELFKILGFSEEEAFEIFVQVRGSCTVYYTDSTSEVAALVRVRCVLLEDTAWH